MLTLHRTTSADTDFIALVKELDADLAIRDGEEHGFYNQFNAIAALKYVVVAYENNIACGCGAIKEYIPGNMEVKRMYTLPAARGKAVATSILKELETWAATLGYNSCILETGVRQPEAIALYKKNGYSITENYGQYAGVKNSVCFAKAL